ncbi:MAG TPA: nitrogenase component 1 [Methylomusa anaerophila]|uniref:Nitrogenase molybdenum-iron protein beta chain n=1 Tax=Methylomusa anaerophila TaxID=1930071 RepID=A0A348AI71_9FIRM|nr:nitrogenase component 1 [Methylomusa anaerophila]BBB90769.1 nitrogenase molybdenum-iron protein beta chain [Methylomusa anaerophila]HML88628.1 nitrogenase component 1 [Methylomusa anaerophila]
MGKCVEQLRHVCALGAYQSVLAIEKAVPVLHAGPGCGAKLWVTLGLQNGCQGSGQTGGHAIPCTNVTEKEVIFGGAEKLREVLGNSLKIMNAGLYAVLTGCTSDIVGDDVGEVVGDFQEQGFPVIYAETGGFKGSNYFGHELVLEAIINQYLKPSAAATEKGLINIWSVVPLQDTFWTGNLEELNRLIGLLGLKPNVIFGPGNGLEALNKVPKAQYNLLISPWVGLKNVKQLEEKFGTPYIHYPVLPIGPTETGKFLRTVAEATGIPAAKAEAVIRGQESKYYYYIERAADILLERNLMPKHFVTIADSFYALGISRFLVNDMGLLPNKQFITDNAPEEARPGIAAEFQNFVDGITAEVTFTHDGGEVAESLRQIKFRGRPLILGSAWDRVVAREVNGYELSVATPVSDRMVLSRGYVGYEGALRLTEDIYTVILNNFQ